MQHQFATENKICDFAELVQRFIRLHVNCMSAVCVGFAQILQSLNYLEGASNPKVMTPWIQKRGVGARQPGGFQPVSSVLSVFSRLRSIPCESDRFVGNTLVYLCSIFLGPRLLWACLIPDDGQFRSTHHRSLEGTLDRLPITS